MPQSVRQSPAAVSTSVSAGERSLGGAAADAVRAGVFFGLFYFYLLLAVKPHLIYDSATITNFPAFYRGWAFFAESMSCPGGALKYVAAFLSHLFYYPWAAAAVITAQAWLVSVCVGYFLRAIALPGARWLRFIPALLVVVTYARYTYHLPLIMATLASLFFACLYVAAVSWRSRGAEGRSASVRFAWGLDPAGYVFLSVVSYVVSGGAYILFAVLCATYELLYHRRHKTGLLYLLFAAALPYVAGVLLFRVSIIDAYTDMLPMSWRVLAWSGRKKMIAAVYALYLFPVAMALAWGVWQILVVNFHLRRMTTTPEPTGKRARTRRGRSKKSLLTRARRRLGGPAVRWTLGTAILFVVAGAAAFLSFDDRQQALLEVHHYACRRMWPQVLDAARRCPDSDYTINAVDRALYHTGRLNRDMCSYLQRPDALLLIGDDRVLWHWHKFDTLIDLGLMNMAEKNLNECMAMFGEHPMILKRLAMVSMVKGETDTARIYLGALSRTLFHNDWADAYLARLDSDPNLSADAEIQSLRARSLTKDYMTLFYAKEPILSTLVEQSGGNRMAFEYLMAWYMLNKQLGKFVQSVGRLGEFGYTEIPPLYQEAIVIYAYGTKKPVPLAGFTISPEAQRRIEHFSGVFNRYNRNKNAAFNELAKDYWGSYLFYYIYAN